MKEFIDKTSTRDGTPINRANLMAIQGFIGLTVSYGDNGEIIETNSNGETLTVMFESDGSITETFSGEKTITKQITFVGNKIVEVLL